MAGSRSRDSAPQDFYTDTAKKTREKIPSFFFLRYNLAWMASYPVSPVRTLSAERIS